MPRIKLEELLTTMERLRSRAELGAYGQASKFLPQPGDPKDCTACPLSAAPGTGMFGRFEQRFATTCNDHLGALLGEIHRWPPFFPSGWNILTALLARFDSERHLRWAFIPSPTLASNFACRVFYSFHCGEIIGYTLPLCGTPYTLNSPIDGPAAHDA